MENGRKKQQEIIFILPQENSYLWCLCIFDHDRTKLTIELKEDLSHSIFVQVTHSQGLDR